ncbi:MAG TPA: NADP-dependent oxidoreductase [Geminicoccaceae bacterium]|nr:NADP-dependent oxidoreductase [Geminicoccus sp.]HMU50793.1 NADP-dependent oxidoreductase [Geminicoccaceae bacterium]
MTKLSRIVLARRPQGAPVPDDFRLETAPLPEPEQGEALVRTVWLSLDPYMRGRMSDARSYAQPVPVGGVIEGEVVGEVMASRDPSLRPGDVVRGRGGWQSHFCRPAAELAKVPPGFPPSTALGVLGMPGLTAHAGLEVVGRPKPGETLVVGAASGPVGSLAGQLARRAGCRVVGIAGGTGKCAWVKEELGFDACLDRHEPDLAGRLAAACPDGVDIYVELTGGAVLDAVLPLLNLHARIPVIGTIAGYNAASPPPGPDRLPMLMRLALTRRLVIQGVLVFDWEHLRPEFVAKAGAWLQAGEIRYREDVAEGLENAPMAFIGMLEGRNFGKQLVRVGADPA